MEFNINAGALQRAVKVLSVVTKPNNTDTTGRVLIEVGDNAVKFTANNGVTAVYFTSSDVKTTQQGVISIAYNKIKSFISSFKVWDGETGVKDFYFKADDRNTIIVVNNLYDKDKTTKSELNITNYNPALMPRLPEFGEASFSLNSTIFRAATNKILYAVNTKVDNSQPALQGMNVKFDDEIITFVGSDGIVLSEYQVKNISGYNKEDIILQHEFIMGLRRLLTDDIQLLWSIDGNRVYVKFDEITYVGRRIIGHEFPNYKAAFDKYTNHINLNKDFFIGLLHPFMDIVDPDDNCRLTLEIKDKVFKVCNTQANTEVVLDIEGGLDFSIDLNGRQLIQTVEAIKDDYVLFKFSNSKGFAIFDSSTFNDQKALISPITKR